jgi:endonuclease/exonuclease/phosphatase family metal-dependent hydrolase
MGQESDGRPSDGVLADEHASVPPAPGPPGRRRMVEIDADELAKLVRRAAADVYSDKSGGRGVLDFEAQERLGRLLDGYDRVQVLRRRILEHRAGIQEALSRLRASLVSRRGFVEDLARTSAWPVDPERWHTLRLRVQARLVAFAEADPKLAPPPRVVAAELLELFAQERAASLAELRRQSDVDLTLLERHLSEVLETLDGAEDALATVRDLPHIEAGLASGYKEVQGLDPEALFRERKKKMLEAIYRRNVDLYREIFGPEPESEAP